MPASELDMVHVEESGRLPLTEFHRKSWYIWPIAIIFGALGTVGIGLGLAMRLGLVHRADGRPDPDTGLLCIGGASIMLMLAVVSIFMICALRRPVLMLRREGFIFREIGMSAPAGSGQFAVYMLIWGVISLRAFRVRLAFIPCEWFVEANVWGSPLDRNLTIWLRLPDERSGGSKFIESPIRFRDGLFRSSLSVIAQTIQDYAQDVSTRANLPSWHDENR
jgi:hypothetical protein